MLSINDLKKGTNITLKGEPYTVVSSMHVKMGRGGGVMQTRLKNLITGQVTEKNFKGQETIEPAELSRKKAQYLYLDQDGAHFMDQENFETITVPRDNLLNQTDYLKEGALVSVLTFKNDPVSIGLPVKVELKVKSAPPVTKGNTASGGRHQTSGAGDRRYSQCSPLYQSR